MSDLSPFTTISKITEKRLAKDLEIIQKDPLEYVDVYPDEKNRLHWYFLIRGPKDTPYHGGFFIGLVMHNPEYPMKPPDYKMLTPNGRFGIGNKICLTNSGYHADQWSAIWNIRSLLEAFLSIMSDDLTDGLQHLHETTEQRKQHAANSYNYNITHNKEILSLFPRFVVNDVNNGLILMKSDKELDAEFAAIKEKAQRKKEKKDKKAKESKEEVKNEVKTEDKKKDENYEIDNHDKSKYKFKLNLKPVPNKSL
jgi:ubiquitin-conjugating enzyme E2 J2